jgi:hypothetical protein
MRKPVVSGLLICEGCVRVSDETACGWRAFLGTEDDDTEVVVVVCPTCAEREFD